METARIALAPRRDLVAVPSSEIILWSSARCSAASRPAMDLAISVLALATALSTPLPRYFDLSPSRSSRASCSPVEAPEGTAARPSAPPSRITSASTVGLPRESMTWRARISVMRLIASTSSQQGLLEGHSLHRPVELAQRAEERLHALERPGVRTIRQRLVRLRVRLHEQPRHPGGDRRARQHRNELALAAGRGALAAGQLHRVGGVDHHRP